MSHINGYQSVYHFADEAGGIIEKASGVFCVAMTALMVSVALLGVTFRYVMESPFEWTEELARFLFLGMGHVAINIGVRKNIHLSVDVIIGNLPRYMKIFLQYIIDLLCCFFLVVLAWKGWHMAQHTMMTAASMNISMFWPYAVVPLGAVLALLQYFFNIIKKTAQLGMSDNQTFVVRS